MNKMTKCSPDNKCNVVILIVLHWVHSTQSMLAWAVHDRIGSRLALEQAYRFVFPLYHSLREAFVWSLAAPGQSERRGRCPEFSLWVSISCWTVVLLASLYLHLGFPGCPRPGAGCPCLVNQLREGYADVRGMLLGKALFFVLFFLNWSPDYVWDSPWRLPGRCLGRGRY